MKRLWFNRCILLTALCGPAELLVHAGEASHHHQAVIHSWDTFSFKIEDSKCRVGIASVKLTVSELIHQDGNLIATYAIHVPLSKSNNDTGQIVMPVNISIDEISRNGGVLKGHSYSDKKKEIANTIICKIGSIETKGIALEITTPKRTLNFESQYTVIESSKDS